MHYEYEETPAPPIKKAVLITSFSVIRSDSPGQEEILLNVQDGTVVGENINFTTKRNVKLAAGSLKSLPAVMTELYGAIAAGEKLPAGKVK